MTYTGYKIGSGGSSAPGTPTPAVASTGASPQISNMNTVLNPDGQPTAIPQFGTQQVDPQLQALLDLFNSAIVGPSQAVANQQITGLVGSEGLSGGQLGGQAGLSVAQGDLQSQLAQQEAGFSQQGLGLQSQQLGIREQALAREMGLLPQQFALQNQGFDLQQAQDIYGAGVSRRSLDSSATSRGAYTSEGVNQQRGDIQQNLDYALQGLGIQRQQAALSNKEQMAQLADAKKQLGITASQLGLSEQEVSARLQNALNQIGIGTQISVDQLMNEARKIQAGEISPISPLLGDIYSLSGIPLGGSALSGGGSDAPKTQVKGMQ